MQVVQAYLYELFTSGEYSKAAELMPSLLQVRALLSTPPEQAAACSITWPAQIACTSQCPKVSDRAHIWTLDKAPAAAHDVQPSTNMAHVLLMHLSTIAHAQLCLSTRTWSHNVLVDGPQPLHSCFSHTCSWSYDTSF